MTFFQAPQAAAVLKHGLLRRYLPAFATKTGSVAGQVVYLDLYAGPGLYDNGSPGSPALALATADVVASYKGNASLHGHLVEKNPDSVAKLKALLAKHQATWDVHQGDAQAHVPAILAGLAPDAPVFAFIDPFGLPISFALVVDIMTRAGTLNFGARVGGAATEVLLNFSTSGVNRAGGQLTAKTTNAANAKAAATNVAKMDDRMGGTWWQPIWLSGAPDRVDRIRDEYAAKLRAAAPGNWGTFDVEVPDTLDAPPAYHLLLFTQHPDGVWIFHESLSSAREEHRDYCLAAQGLLDLDPLPQREKRWTAELEANVEQLLVTFPSGFQPVTKITQVYGTTFGYAREKHLRKAIESLKSQGKVSTDIKNKKLDRVWIMR